MPAKIHNLDTIKRLGSTLTDKSVHGNRAVIAKHSNATIMPVSKPPDKRIPLSEIFKDAKPRKWATPMHPKPYRPRRPVSDPNKPLVFSKTPAELQMAKVDIQPAGLHTKQTLETPPNPTTPRNFPENELQLNKHYAAVAQAGPNPADAFR